MGITNVLQNTYYRIVGFPDKPLQVTKLLAGKDSVMIDVGANVGEHAFAALGYVYAIEPCRETFEKLTARKQEPHSRRRFFNIAFSDAKGEKTLYINPRNPGNNSVVPHSGKIAGETVQCVTLDDFVKEHGIRPTYIKIDTEGHEMEVLAGGMMTIETYKPALLIEGNAQTLDSILVSLGYMRQGVDRINHFYFAN